MKPFDNEIDKEKSIMVGDRDADLEFAKNLGIKGYKIGEKYGWKGVVDNVLQRKASIKRTTKETDVFIELNIDGNGKCDIFQTASPACVPLRTGPGEKRRIAS